jgi:hypothetical protein
VFVFGGDSPAARRPTPGLGTTQLAGRSGADRSAVPTIWAFDAATRQLLPAGRLQVPVSHAAVTVTGSTAWIMGGESGGTAVSAVQMLRPDRAFGTAGAPGAGSPYFGAKLLIANRGNNRRLAGANPGVQSRGHDPVPLPGCVRAGEAQPRHHRQAGHRGGGTKHPDGFDLLLPDGSTPTHPVTG